MQIEIALFLFCDKRVHRRLFIDVLYDSVSRKTTNNYDEKAKPRFATGQEEANGAFNEFGC